jgi:hypothetical protein
MRIWGRIWVVPEYRLIFLADSMAVATAGRKRIARPITKFKTFKTFKSRKLGSRRGLVETIDVAAVVEFFDEAIIDKVFRFGALRLGIFFRQ